MNMERTKAFPRNTKIDVLLTFTSDGAKASDTGGGKRGSRISDVALTVQAVTVQQHHSFVKLPIRALDRFPSMPAREHSASGTSTTPRRFPSL